MNLSEKQGCHLVDEEGWHQNYGELLTYIALSKVNDYHLAQDLVQETFISAWKGIKNFRGDCSEKTFLCGILNNKIIDFYRSKVRRPTLIASQIEREDESGDFFSNLPDLKDDVDPTSILNRADFVEALEAAVEKLPVKMRQAVQLRIIDDRPTSEVTKELGITEGCMWVTIHRAKKELRVELESDWDANSLVQRS